MKKIIVGTIALLFLATALRAELPVWFEGAAVVNLDKPVNLVVQGNVLLDVVKNLQVRATVVAINLTHYFRLSLSSGVGLDLLLHARGKGKVSFYIVGGFNLSAGEGGTIFTGKFGPGFVLAQSKRMKLFLEPLLNFTKYFGDTHVGVSIGAGVRCR